MQQAVLAGALVLALSVPLAAQHIATPPHVRVASSLDSGFLHNSTAQSRVVFSQQVAAEQAPWVLLEFGAGVSLPEGSFLRMTAAGDGDVQHHTALTLLEWQGFSAAFNGDGVLLELVAGPNTRGNRVTVAGMFQGLAPRPAAEDICGATDDRTLSNDPRQGRLFLGCTGWLAGDDIMLSAGHCQVSGQPLILEMNVPLSNANGSVRRAAVNDQYPYTVLASLNSGIGSDWLLARMGANSNTGMLPAQANGNQWYALGGAPNNGSMRITGYGTTSSPVSGTWNQVQKTHAGPVVSVQSDHLIYNIDTTGGNSGSPVEQIATNTVVAIHTHGGCSTGGNHGTRLDRADIQLAIRNATITPGTYRAYGTGCAGTGVSGGMCAGTNPSGGTLNGFTSTNNEFGYPITLASAIQLDAVELYSSSTTGGNIGLPIGIYLDAGGQPSSTPIATATMSVGGTAGWYRATLQSPVTIPAGTFYIGADHTGAQTRLSALTQGTAVTSFYRAPFGRWAVSGLVSIPAARAICAGGAGAIPVLTGTGLPETGQNMGLAVAFAKPSTAAVVFFGISDTTWALGLLPFPLFFLGAPGCEILSSPDVGIATTIDAQGNGSLNLPMPMDPNLVGISFYHQYAVVDPGANQLGLAFSNGLEMTIGG